MNFTNIIQFTVMQYYQLIKFHRVSMNPDNMKLVRDIYVCPLC